MTDKRENIERVERVLNRVIPVDDAEYIRLHSPNPKVEESIREIDVAIEKKEDAHQADIHELRRMRSILDKYRKKRPCSTSEIREVMSLLCFNNLGFCCGPDKNCFHRNAVLEVLGIDLNDYTWKKASFGYSLARNMYFTENTENIKIQGGRPWREQAATIYEWAHYQLIRSQNIIGEMNRASALNGIPVDANKRFFHMGIMDACNAILTYAGSGGETIGLIPQEENNE